MSSFHWKASSELMFFQIWFGYMLILSWAVISNATEGSSSSALFLHHNPTGRSLSSPSTTGHEHENVPTPIHSPNINPAVTPINSPLPLHKFHNSTAESPSSSHLPHGKNLMAHHVNLRFSGPLLSPKSGPVKADSHASGSLTTLSEYGRRLSAPVSDTLELLQGKLSILHFFFTSIASNSAPPSLSPDVGDCCESIMISRPGSHNCSCVYPIKLELLILNLSTSNTNWSAEFQQELASQLGLSVVQFVMPHFHIDNTNELNISIDIAPLDGLRFSYREAHQINYTLVIHKLHLNSSLYGDYRLLNFTWFEKPVIPIIPPGDGPIDSNPMPPPTNVVDWTYDHKKHSRVIIVAVVAVVVSVVSVLLAIIFYYYKMMNKAEPKKKGTTTSLPSTGAAVRQERAHSGLPSNLQTMSIIADAGLSSKQQHFLEPTEVYTNLSLDDRLYIKSYCRKSRPIGKGSFARVYKMIFHGEVLAIKEIKHRSPHTKRWVQNEVELLLGKEHMNINKLYAWCIEEKISYLAYMYIGGCSLDEYLRGNCVGFTYSWVQSFSMIMGIARGIEFLHSNKIIHVDIKPQNIMVDANDNEAKIVDFGLSKHVDWEGSHRSTGMIVGTKGYWAPEHCWNNKISYKHDVYSFGIVVLEMITGQRHVDEARGSSQFHIPGYVRHMIENNRFEEAVDPRLKQDGWDSFALEEALAVRNIALRCAHPDRAERPDMNLVVTELTSMMSSGHNNITREQKEEEIVTVEDVTYSKNWLLK